MPGKNGQESRITLGSLLPSAASKTKVKYHFVDDDFQEKYARVFQLIAAAHDDEGNPREGASLIIFAESARLKACLVDKHTGMRSFYVLDANESVWEQIERALELGADWREKKGTNGAFPTH